MQAQKAQNLKRGRAGGRGRGGRHAGNSGNKANLAHANVNEIAPTYNSIFGGLAFCLKAATNGRIRKARGVWIKDNGITHHMHHDKSLFLNYHPLKYRLYVGGIGSGLKAVGDGDVEIRDCNGKTHMLKRVLHVPKLQCGLMSLNTLALVGLNSLIT
jgi:hypothetical protein